jgi:hypothetical protein
MHPICRRVIVTGGRDDRREGARLSPPALAALAAVGGGVLPCAVALVAGWVRISRPEGILAWLGSGGAVGALVAVVARQVAGRRQPVGGVHRFAIERKVARGGMGVARSGRVDEAAAMARERAWAAMD